MVFRHGACAHPAPDLRPCPAARRAAPAGRRVGGFHARMRFGGLFRERSFYRSDAAKTAYRGLRRGFAKVGLDVVVKTFYSPIPDLDQLPAGTFERRAGLPGVDWDLDRQLEHVRGLREPLAEFRTSVAASAGGDRYQWARNESYIEADAAMLYATVRSARPKRVVELGSGHSTLVTAQALRRNAADGHAAALEVFDPFPSVVDDGLPGLTRLERIGAQQVPLQTFETLEAGDVLFVDTTHTVKVGSDVNFIVLEVLPRLRAGVHVHLHDIFLPYEYPKQWLEDYGLYWTEQYLVHAFLAFNSGFEVLASMHALQRDRRDAMAELLTPEVAEWAGGAFWMRRTAG
jgi:Methyltransferase domain